MKYKVESKYSNEKEMSSAKNPSEQCAYITQRLD